MKNSPFEPKKTVVFVAWSGGERGDGLGVNEVMNAMTGFSNLTVETVIELSGVGAGSGDEIALGQGSSYRLIQLFQECRRQPGRDRDDDPRSRAPLWPSRGDRIRRPISH